MGEEFLTVGQAAEEYGISRVTLWKRIKDGELVTQRSGRDRRYHLLLRADLDRVLGPQMIRPREADEGKGKAAA